MSKKVNCWNCGRLVDRVTYIDSGITYCPHCNCVYPEKPKLEAELTLIQDDFLKTRSKKSYEQLFFLLRTLTFNIICSKLKKSQGRSYDDIEDMTDWTMMKLCEYYNSNTFKITGSFTGYLSKVVLYPLYNKDDKERKEKEISIYTPTNENEEKTILDTLCEKQDDFNFESKYFNDLDKENLILELNIFLKQIFKKSFEIGGIRKSIRMALLFKHLIEGKSDRFFSDWWSTSDDFDLQNNYFQCVEVFKKLLRQNVRCN